MEILEKINLKTGKNFLRLKVIPNSSKTEIVEIMENAVLKIKIKAIPEKWKANAEVINFFSKGLKINKQKINITSGKTSSLKTIKIDF